MGKELVSLTTHRKIMSHAEEKRAYWLFVIPAFAIYLFVMAFPTIFAIFLSLTNYKGGALFGPKRKALEFVGLKYYKEMFTNKYFWLALKNNLWIVFVSVFGQIPLGFFMAYLIFRGMIKGKDFFQTVIYLPCVISTVVIGKLWSSIMSPNGLLPDIIKIFNPSYVATNSEHPIIPVLFVILWMYTGTYLIIFLANLQKIDVSVIEAAKIDGATEFQALRYIILPSLSGVIVTSAILAISGSLKSFDLIYVMTAGGPAKQTYVLSIFMYDSAFNGAPNYPLANAISIVMCVISFALIGITKAVEKKFGGRE